MPELRKDIITEGWVIIATDRAKRPHEFGFSMSYPRDNPLGVMYEPWHWRFIGVALATKLHNENKYFYDLDQREIDTYLSKIFDQIPQ